MHIIVDSKDLSDALSIAIGSIANNPILPVLDAFKIEAEKNEITITASDLEVITIVTVEAKVQEDGISIIPAKMLLDTAKSVPHQPIEIVTNKKCEIRTHNGNYSMPVFEDDYPDIPEVEGDVFDLPVSYAVESLFACSNDNLRPAMTGVYFDLTNGVEFCATEGHILTVTSLAGEGSPVAVVVPKNAIQMLKGIEMVDCVIDSNNALFQYDNVTHICRLIDARFPDYKNIIPDNDKKMVIDRAGLLSAVKRVQLYANKAIGSVVFDIANDLLKISSQDVDFDHSASEEMTCDSDFEMKIAFNSKYLIDALSNIAGDDVEFYFDKPSSAALVKEGDKTILLMPIVMT